MDQGRETPLLIAVKGVLAGMGGAVALIALVAAARTLPDGREAPEVSRLGPGMSAGQALAEGPGMPPNINQFTAVFIQKIATGTLLPGSIMSVTAGR